SDALTVAEDLRVEPDAVVANPHRELLLSVRDLCLDGPCARMLECVTNGLSSDSVELIACGQRQLWRFTFRDHPKEARRFAAGCRNQLLAECNQRLHEVSLGQ